MKIRKSKMLLGLAIAGGVLYSSQDVAKADLADTVINFIGSQTPASIRPTLCKKYGPVRMGGGFICATDKRVAALVLAVCGGVGDFDDSQCAKAATAKLSITGSPKSPANQATITQTLQQADPALEKKLEDRGFVAPPRPTTPAPTDR